LAIEPPAGLSAQLVEQIAEPIMILAASGDDRAPPVISYVNPAAARLIGRAAEALIGQSFQVLASAITAPVELARLVDAIDGQRAIELALQIVGASGRRLWTEVEGRPLAGSDRTYAIRLRDITAQRTVVANARRLERRFDALARLTSDGVYHLRVDPDCRLVLDWMAGAFERLTGYGVAEIEALGGWSALVEPADLRLVQRRAQKLLAGEQASAEYRIKSRDGSRRWLRDTGWPQWDQAHELVVGILCAADDITEQRRLEEQLLAEQLDRKALIGLTDGLVCEIDGDGGLRAVAGNAAGELPARLQGGVGRPLQDVIGLDLADTWRQQIARVIPGWAPVTFTFIWPAGAAVEHYRVRLCGAAGGIVLALVQPASPTAAPDAPQLETGPDPRLRALLELQRSAAVLLSPDLTVLELNDQAGQLTGWQRESVVDRPFLELMALAREQPALLEDLERARSGARVSGSEAWLRLPNGQEGRLVWSYVPLRGAGDELYGVLAQPEALTLVEAASPHADDQLRLRAILDHVADGIVTLDTRGVVVSFSRSAEAIFGYRRDEIVGRGIDVLVVRAAGRDGDALDLITATAKLPGATREMLARRKGGEVIPIELTPSEVLFNGDMLYILTIRDITVRKHTEETIRNLAYHDPLTGLPNRLLFNDRLTQAIERARRSAQLLAVMILDLDRFKLINAPTAMPRRTP
jgi:PAS domain S-box-containing protein